MTIDACDDLAVRPHRHLPGDEHEIAGAHRLGEGQRAAAGAGRVGAEAFDGHASLLFELLDGETAFGKPAEPLDAKVDQEIEKPAKT